MIDPLLRNDRSFLFLVELDKAGIIALSLVPVIISDCQVSLAKGMDCTDTTERMRLLSKQFQTSLTLRESPLPHLFLKIRS